MAYRMPEVDLSLARQISQSSRTSSSSSSTNVPKGGDIQYELPKVVGSLKDGWLESFQAMAVVAALFAGMEASLITLVKTPEPDGHPPLRFGTKYQNAVLGLSYVALALNVGCILSALRIIDVLGRMTYASALGDHPPDPAWYLKGEAGLLGAYGVKGRTRLLIHHCWYCLALGSLCVLAQVMMYVWLHEAMPVVWATLVGVILAALPMLLMIW